MLYGGYREEMATPRLCESRSDPLIRYLFNPYVILSSLARSTTSIDNALVLGAISLACGADALSAASSGAVLALAAYTSLYPILLLPPVLLTIRSRNAGPGYAGVAFITTLGACLCLGHQHWRVM